MTNKNLLRDKKSPEKTATTERGKAEPFTFIVVLYK
jgi:hypothetical protein